MKIVKTGWMAKSLDLKDAIRTRPEDMDFDIRIYSRKGKSYEWHPMDWPPRRVKITVEFDEVKK